MPVYTVEGKKNFNASKSTNKRIFLFQLQWDFAGRDKKKNKQDQFFSDSERKSLPEQLCGRRVSSEIYAQSHHVK